MKRYVYDILYICRDFVQVGPSPFSNPSQDARFYRDKRVRRVYSFTKIRSEAEALSAVEQKPEGQISTELDHTILGIRIVEIEEYTDISNWDDSLN